MDRYTFMPINIPAGAPIIIDDGVTKFEVTESFQAMKDKELQQYQLNPNASFVKYRRIIVDWIAEVGEEFGLSQLCIHSSVRYLDVVLNKITVPKTSLQLVAMACILIAAKFEEREDDIPPLQELNECSNNTYTTTLIRQMEGYVLSTLDWSLKCITPVHYIRFYVTAAADPVVDKYGERPVDDRVTRYIYKYTEFFLDLCLQEYEFQMYRPSILAAAVVAAARRAVKVSPIWSPKLAFVTSYDEDEIDHCMSHIYSTYEQNFPTGDQAGRAAVKDAEAMESPVDVRDCTMECGEESIAPTA